MSDRLRILYVAYPLLPVSHESCGGAEQVLCSLERLMHRRGHATTVAAPAGSRVSGDLLVTAWPTNEPDQLERCEREQRAAIIEAIRRCEREGKPFDLVHDHSGAFWQFAAQFDLPVLATLHLPRDSYRDELFSGVAANLFFNCVSQPQSQQFKELPNFTGVIENGVDLGQFRPHYGRRSGHLLWLGRICEEKGPHIALDVAKAARVPLILAGQVYPFSYHQRYYQREIVPCLHALGSQAKEMTTPNLSQKLELLRQARAVLIPSTVEESSSLVAMEAMACGTPVIAFRRGALAQIVHHGTTGFLVESAEEMAAAIPQIAEIDPNTCRRRAEQLHSDERMVSGYEQLYQRILKSWRGQSVREFVA